MKRILVVAIAAVFTVAFAVSAMADVKIGGEYRLRMEKWDNTNLTENENSWCSSANRCDDNGAQYGQRVRLWVVATPTDDTEIKVTLQDTRVWGDMPWGEQYNYDWYDGQWVEQGGPGLTGAGLNNHGLDVHESYLAIKNVFGTPISAKMGRQELNYGDQRLIGSFGWSNNGRSFDAWKLTYNSDMVDVDFVNAKLVDNNMGVTYYAGDNININWWGNFPYGGQAKPGDSDNDKDLYVLYATVKAIPNNTLDLYYLWLRDGSNFFGQQISDNSSALGSLGTVISQELITYGFRLNGKFSGLDYTLEMPFQTGEIAVASGTGQKADIDASAMAVKVGYTLPGENKIRIGLEYDKASGDSDRTDMDIETFANLYPTNHDKYGFMDLQGWRNMVAWNVNVAGNITEKLNARFDYWNFALDTVNDDWYGAGHWNGGLYAQYGVRNYQGTNCGWPTGQKCSDEIGTEIDLTFNYKYNAAVGIQLALSRFMPGDAIEGRLETITGGTPKMEDMDWMSLMITGKF